MNNHKMPIFKDQMMIPKILPVKLKPTINHLKAPLKLSEILQLTN